MNLDRLSGQHLWTYAIQANAYEHKPLWPVWMHILHLEQPWYFLGAGIAQSV
jgi:hypothetical protein